MRVPMTPLSLRLSIAQRRDLLLLCDETGLGLNEIVRRAIDEYRDKRIDKIVDLREREMERERRSKRRRA